MMDAHISYRVENGIARITMARPPVNAMTLGFVRAIVGALDRARDDADARVVVIESAVAGRFSAGLDLPLLADADAATVRDLLTALYVDLYDAQHRLGKPSIAAVGGTARGGGVTLAISCDVIVAGEDATFGYPEIDRALPPAIHFVHLPRIVGRHRAFELLFSGRSFDAGEALALGLVQRVAPSSEATRAALEMAATFAAKPVDAVRMARAAFMRQNDTDYRRSIATAVEDFCSAFARDGVQARLQSFAGQRGRR